MLAAPIVPPGAGGRPRLRRPRVVGQTLELLHRCRSQAQAVTHIARLRLDAATYEPATPRRTGQNGRPPPKGQRLPPPKSPIAPSRSVLGRRPGGLVRRHHPHGGTHLAYRGVVSRGRPPAPLCRVLIRDPHGGYATQGLLRTDLAVDPVRTQERSVLRRQLEATLQWVQAHLGVETQSQ